MKYEILAAAFSHFIINKSHISLQRMQFRYMSVNGILNCQTMFYRMTVLKIHSAGFQDKRDILPLMLTSFKLIISQSPQKLQLRITVHSLCVSVIWQKYSTFAGIEEKADKNQPTIYHQILWVPGIRCTVVADNSCYQYLTIPESNNLLHITNCVNVSRCQPVALQSSNLFTLYNVNSTISIYCMMVISFCSQLLFNLWGSNC